MKITYLIIFVIFSVTVYCVNIMNREKKLIKLFNNSIKFPDIDILNNVKKIEKIPYTIHQTIKNNNDLENFKEEIAIKEKKCKNFTFKYYTDENIIEYIKKYFDDRVLNAYMKIGNNFGPCKADLFRYLVLYNEGGVYIDIKSTIEKDITHIIDNNPGKLLITNENKYIDIPKYFYFKIKHSMNKGEFIQWFIISNKGNIMLKKIIENIIYNIELENLREEKKFYDKDGVLLLTGPVMFSETIIENDYKECKIIENFFDNSIKYKIKNHKKKFSNHYTKHNNFQIIN